MNIILDGNLMASVVLTSDVQEVKQDNTETDNTETDNTETQEETGGENDYYAPEQEGELGEDTGSFKQQVQQTVRNPLLSNTLFIGGFSMLVFLGGVFLGALFSWKKIRSGKVSMEED